MPEISSAIRTTLCLASASVGWTNALHAQVLRVELRDATTSAAVSGALVKVLDSTGVTRADGMSGDGGVVSIPLTRDGTYTLSIHRLGVRPQQLPGVRVEANATRSITFPVASVGERVAPSRGDAQTTCGRAPSGDDLTAELWDQASLALHAAVITQREARSMPPVRVVHRNTVLTADRVQVSSTITQDYRGVNRMPVGQDPAQLASEGYVRRVTGRNVAYHAPNERVFVSEAFLATHCFSASTGNTRGKTAELRFKPIKGRRIADIEGAMLVDLTTGELQRITFSYVNSPERARAPFAGGEIWLRRLPDGTWMMRRWAIRFPRVVSSSPTTDEWELIGYTEFTGEVEEPQPDSRAPQPPDR